MQGGGGGGGGGCQAGSLCGEISLFLIRGALEEVSVEHSERKKSLWAIKCFYILTQFQILFAHFYHYSRKTFIAINLFGLILREKKDKSNISSCNLSDWPDNYMVPVISQKWYFICRFASCWMIDAVTRVILQGSVNWHLLQHVLESRCVSSTSHFNESGLICHLNCNCNHSNCGSGFWTDQMKMSGACDFFFLKNVNSVVLLVRREKQHSPATTPVISINTGEATEWSSRCG